MRSPGVLRGVDRLGAVVFLPVRKLTGPLHRRRRSFDNDQNDSLAPLPEPWTDSRWFRGGPPPRLHNDVVPLPHGEEYFRDLHDTLLTARRRVTICGWCLTPLMALLRDEGQGTSILAELLDRVSKHADVYVLLWSGAPALFEPTQRMVQEARRVLLDRAPSVHCEIDRSAPFSHDQHQKAVTVDGRVAYVGGMDLSTFQGDRWDTARHELRFGPNWHDVQARLQGEIVRDVESNFCQRWNAVTGERLEPLPPPDPDPSWNTPAQVVRTIPAGFYPFAPDGEFGIYHALKAAIDRAQRYIYLENQYIWSPEIVEALVDAMNRPHREPFRIVLVLPAMAYTGKYDNDDHVRLLSETDAGRGMFHAYSLYAGGPALGVHGYRYLPIYVHAKVSIVDDEWFSIGSANLNRRGLATDAEMNVQCIAPEIARSLRVRLWAEHLQEPEDQIAKRDPIAVIDESWRSTAENLEWCITRSTPPPKGQVRLYRPGHNVGSRLLDIIQDVSLEH